MTKRLIPRTATLGDAGFIKDILEEAATLPNMLGIEQWPEKFNAKDIEANIEVGGVYVFTDGKVDIGTVDYRTHDEQIWGADPANAAYIHRLAIRSSERGKGVGADILRWCLEKAQCDNKSAVRLDCVTSNERLKAYYQSLGFYLVRDVTWTGGRTSLFQHNL